MDDEKKLELNVEEPEERIAPSGPECIFVMAGEGARFTD